jgi:hypothetical protein
MPEGFIPCETEGCDYLATDLKDYNEHRKGFNGCLYRFKIPPPADTFCSPVPGVPKSPANCAKLAIEEGPWAETNPSRWSGYHTPIELAGMFPRPEPRSPEEEEEEEWRPPVAKEPELSPERQALKNKAEEHAAEMARLAAFQAADPLLNLKVS